MSANDRPVDPALLESFGKNRDSQPLELFLAHLNQYVAWSPDGTRIVASGTTWNEVEQRLRVLGVDSSQVVFEYITDPDIVYL